MSSVFFTFLSRQKLNLKTQCLPSWFVLSPFLLLLAIDATATEVEHKAGKNETSQLCGNGPEAKLLAQLIKADKLQQRSKLRCNSLLTQLAEEKARTMQEHGKVTHNVGGSPNARLVNGGYQLPDYYGRQPFANQVEAIAGGYADAEDVWKAFKKSDAHRSHLLGEHEFYREQDEIGVAFIREWHSPHVEYWVVYVSKGHSPNQSEFDGRTDLPNKADKVVQEFVKPKVNLK